MNAEERRLLLEETMLIMDQRIAELRIRDRNNGNTEDKSLRIDVSEFTGQALNPEKYLDWEGSLEGYFEYKDTPLDKQYKIAKVKLTKLAATWLEGLQRQRVREGKGKIDSWEKLKKKLRRKYIPGNYNQQLSMQWNSLTQGNRLVAQYIQDWERLSVLCDITDSEDMRVGKFFTGLREDLRVQICQIPNLIVALAGSHAKLLEQYSRKRPTSVTGQSFASNSSTTTTKSTNTTPPLI